MRALTAVLLMLAASQASGTDCGNLATRDAQLACYDRLARCAGTPDPDERLSCYRRASSAAIDPTPPGDRGPSGPAAAAREPTPAAGAPVTQAPAPESVSKSFDATVVDVSRDHRGRSYLTLDNGQVYRELSEGRFRFEAGMRVRLSHGLFGSTNLHAEGMDKYVKVREVEP